MLGEKYTLARIPNSLIRPAFRLRALRDFADVKRGDFGGIVGHADTLSHKGCCWIYDEAIVSADAFVHDDAQVRGRAYIQAGTIIRNSAVVRDNASLSGDISLNDCAQISGMARIYGTFWITNRVQIQDDVYLTGEGELSDDVVIKGSTCLKGDIYLSGSAQIDLKECGKTIHGRTTLGHDAKIEKESDIFRVVFARYGTYTFYKRGDGQIATAQQKCPPSLQHELQERDPNHPALHFFEAAEKYFKNE